MGFFTQIYRAHESNYPPVRPRKTSDAFAPAAEFQAELAYKPARQQLGFFVKNYRQKTANDLTYVANKLGVSRSALNNLEYGELYTPLISKTAEDYWNAMPGLPEDYRDILNTAHHTTYSAVYGPDYASQAQMSTSLPGARQLLGVIDTPQLQVYAANDARCAASHGLV
jgi:DNA-binding XRE family transcriptional regulator